MASIQALCRVARAKLCKANITFYLLHLLICKVYITFIAINQNKCIMKTNYLLAPSYKKYGMLLSIVFACGCLYCLFSNQDDLFGALLEKAGKAGDWFNELCILGLTAGLLFTAFSREKDEDEYIAHLRMHSWTVAIVCHYLILVVGTLCFYDVQYLTFVFINMFTIPILFIGVFQWKLYRFRKDNHE